MALKYNFVTKLTSLVVVSPPLEEKNENLVKGIKKDNLMRTKRLIEKVAKMIEPQSDNSDEFICAYQEICWD